MLLTLNAPLRVKNKMFKSRSVYAFPGMVILILFSTSIFITGLFVFPQYQHHDPNKCGIWRWNIKTLTDREGTILLSEKPVPSSVDQLVKEMPPKVLYDNSHTDGMLPRYPSENLVVEVTAYVTHVRFERDDRDLHLILKSPGSENTMVGEIPDPTCPTFDTFPSLRTYFEQTRTEGYDVWDRLKATHLPVKVKVTGVPFWDGAHSQRPIGASEYYREIHPILKIEVLSQ